MPSVVNQLAEGATRKLGPLPAWAWGVVAAGGVYAYRFIRGRSSSGRAVQGADLNNDGSSVIPSLAGGGAPPPTTGYGAPEGPGSGLYVSTPDFTYEGPGETVGSIIEQILAGRRQDTSTGGGGGTAPTRQPTAQPAPSPSTKPPAQTYDPDARIRNAILNIFAEEQLPPPSASRLDRLIIEVKQGRSLASIRQGLEDYKRHRPELGIPV